MAPRKLRDLIRLIRSAKTAAEERDLINKECADIRESFRKEEKDYRCRNLSKCLYVFMLGYPAHFAQIECLNLVVSQKFSDKRVGYLGTMLLLDESKELHMMVTNGLKLDMQSGTPHVVGLALCTMGSITSKDMARDLSSDVETLLKSTNPLVKKKAALCAVRMIRKEPTLVEVFLPATRALLTDRNHGVLVAGIALIEEMCLLNPECLVHFRRLVPTLVRQLKSLMTSGYSPEHDVNGITDPFLQTGILRLLRVLGKGDTEASEAMNDALAEVATNTPTTTNAGNAVLYEAVRSIMEIQAESGLRILAINNLGKFLLNHDRNIRYVALTTLLRTVQNGDNSSDAVQRHRETIVDCLRESDVTIRKRALALAFALINQNNVSLLVTELLAFLKVADTEFKSYIVTELLMAADKYAPSNRWHVDTCLEILRVAGPYIQEEGVADIVQILASYTELHRHVVQELYVAVQKAKSAQPLIQVAAWCLGEFTEQLLSAGAFTTADGDTIAPTPDKVLDLFQLLLSDPTNTRLTKEFILNAIMKMSARTADGATRIRTMVNNFRSSMDEELQQRASEYTTIFTRFDHLRPALLERMPVTKSKVRAVAVSGLDNVKSPTTAAPAARSGGNDLLDLLADGGSAPPAPTAAAPASAPSGNILDLLGLTGGSSAPAPAAVAGGGGGLLDLMGGFGGSSTAAAPAPASSGGLDLLGGLLGGSSAPAPAAPSSGGGIESILNMLNSPTAPPPAAAPMGGGFGGLGGLGMGGPAVAAPVGGGFDLAGLGLGGPAAPAAPSGGVSFVPLEEGGFQLTFKPERTPNPSVVKITMITKNATPTSFDNYNLQVAVPKNFGVVLSAASGTSVPAFNLGDVTQIAQVTLPEPGAPIRMLLRISYTVNGQEVVKQHQVGQFPPF